MVSWRTGPVLYDALAAALDAQGVVEVILVDNGNPTADQARLDAWAHERPRLKILRGHGNIGFARGCNLGAEAARGDYLLILNPDAILEPDAPLHLIAVLAIARRPAIAGAFVADLQGREQRGARRRELTAWRLLMELTGCAARWPDRPWARGAHMHGEPPPEGPTPVDAVSGACFAVAREDFLRLGGFDARYFLHVEDVDLCRAAREAGGAVWYAPAARAVHHRGTSAAARLRVEWSKAIGFSRYFRKYAQSPAARIGYWLLTGPILALGLARGGAQDGRTLLTRTIKKFVAPG